MPVTITFKFSGHVLGEHDECELAPAKCFPLVVPSLEVEIIQVQPGVEVGGGGDVYDATVVGFSQERQQQVRQQEGSCNVTLHYWDRMSLVAV